MPEPLDVNRLRLLREVSLRGSISGAARELGLTASAVSQQLSALEREAGVALLDRSTRGVVLTGAGHALVERAHAIVGLLEQARADLDRLSHEVAGPVRLAAVASAAATFVSRAASALATDHPGIELSVTAVEPATAIDYLVAGTVDVAVVDVYDGVPLAAPEHLVATKLVVESLVLVTPRGDAPGATLAGLEDRGWVMPPESAACGQAVRFACREAGFEPLVRWETDDMLLLVRAVEAGHGVAVLPRLSVAADVADVEVRPLRRPALKRRLTALTRSSAVHRATVGATLDALVAAAHDEHGHIAE